MWKIRSDRKFTLNTSRLTFFVHILLLLTKNKIMFSNQNVSLTQTLKLLNYKNMNLASLKNVVAKSAFLKPNLLKVENASFRRKLSKSWKKKLVLNFLHLNTWITNPSLEVHHSFITFYYFNKQSNLGVFNLKRVLTVWTNVLNFVQNLFFFNLTYVFFSSSYFKYESLSFNWMKNNHLKSLWRYTNPFIFFLNNKTTLYNDIFFKLLSKKAINISFLVDVYYHKRTVYYLQKYKFTTIGPVPISSSFYLLNITFPTSSNSVFSNLFFIRLITRVKKMVLYNKYQGYKNSTLSQHV